MSTTDLESRRSTRPPLVGLPEIRYEERLAADAAGAHVYADAVRFMGAADEPSALELEIYGGAFSEANTFTTRGGHPAVALMVRDPQALRALGSALLALAVRAEAEGFFDGIGSEPTP